MTKEGEDIVGPAPSIDQKIPTTPKPNESENGQHTRLVPTASPSISACTTATNLSSLDAPQLHKMSTLEENLRVAQPEIEPLQNKKIGVEEQIYNDTVAKKPPIKLFTQVLTALSVSLVSLVIGFVSAYTSPAEESLKKDLGITDNQYSWIGSLMPLSALVGGLVGGQLIEILGRKRTIVLTDILYIISWLICANATDIWFVYVGRSIIGFSVGIASLAIPVYLGETIQPEIRGALGLFPAAFGNSGILLCFIVGSYLKWNELAWLGVALPVPFLVLMFLIPETPRWYVSKGRDEEALKALQSLRGKDTNVSEEFDDLVKSHKESQKLTTNATFKDLFVKANMKPLMICLGLMFFQQLSGINAVIFYTTTIFKMAGSSINQNLCTIIVGLVNFISTFIATILIDKLGRKVLLYISSISMTLNLSILGTYFYLRHTGVDVSAYGWLPLASFVIYVLGFSLGFGPIPWLMLGEILPAKIRGSAASVATAFNWACTFLVTKTFVDIINLIGPHGTFWLFTGFVVFSILFIYLWVPETLGKSLEDIERKFAGVKVRRISSVVNLKPLPSSF